MASKNELKPSKRKNICFYCQGTGKRGYKDGNSGVVYKNIYDCSHCNGKGIVKPSKRRVK